MMFCVNIGADYLLDRSWRASPSDLLGQSPGEVVRAAAPRAGDTSPAHRSGEDCLASGPESPGRCRLMNRRLRQAAALVAALAAVSEASAETTSASCSRSSVSTRWSPS